MQKGQVERPNTTTLHESYSNTMLFYIYYSLSLFLIKVRITSSSISRLHCFPSQHPGTTGQGFSSDQPSSPFYPTVLSSERREERKNNKGNSNELSKGAIETHYKSLSPTQTPTLQPDFLSQTTIPMIFKNAGHLVLEGTLGVRCKIQHHFDGLYDRERIDDTTVSHFVCIFSPFCFFNLYQNYFCLCREIEIDANFYYETRFTSLPKKRERERERETQTLCYSSAMVVIHLYTVPKRDIFFNQTKEMQINNIIKRFGIISL